MSTETTRLGRSRLGRRSDATKSKPGTRPIPHTSTTTTALTASTSSPFMNDDNDNERPAKRQKLDLRFKQSTIDAFLARQNAASEAIPTRPPTKLSVNGPHGLVVETINGVRTELDLGEDELALSGPPSRRSTPKPAISAAILAETNGARGGRRTATPQPANSGTKQEDKRTLRSQDDGPRLKSELATYFPNYEDVVFDAPEEHEYITTETVFYITDDSAQKQQARGTPSKPSMKGTGSSPQSSRKPSINGGPSPSSSSNAMNGCQRLDLDFAFRSLPGNPEDPLSEEHFGKSHRRAERREKQLRNIEKERAMHEKVQLDRLLDGLLGHDWLRVMGISGVTDTEARKFEPKRDYFIAEVQALIDKFRTWKEEERRQRLEKDEARRAADEEGDEDEGGDDVSEDSILPPSSELNASAARQLKQEAAESLRSASRSASQSSKLKLKLKAPTTPSSPVRFRPPSPLEPIKSFYDRRHLREAAIKKTRAGRNITAFGRPLPDMEQREFVLPGDLVSEDVLRANAREKRARKRRSVADAAAGGA